MSYNGLTSKEVKDRIKNGMVNEFESSPSKTIKQILIENTCTLFNFINIILAIAIIMVGSYKNLLFLGVVICNTLISTVQEIRAKKVVDKLSVISSVKAKVKRDNQIKNIHISNIVKDDLIYYELGNQVVVDSVITNGTCEVNESFITGESKSRFKKEGDTLLSGSFIISGSCEAKVIHVGMENYTAVISHDAKKAKKEINSEIMRSLNKIVKYVSVALVPIGILLLLRQFNISDNTTQKAVVKVVAALIGMIPEGLILLVSTVLGISVVKLSRYNVLVQDLYSIETLARVDTLCLDKTGTLTEGVMELTDVVVLNDHKVNEVDEVLEAISSNLNDNNPTFRAINEKYGNDSNIKTKSIIPFSSERKYSGITYKEDTYIMGAPEFILEKDFKKYESKVASLSEENRVLALIKTKILKDGTLSSKKDVLAFLLIGDKIRKEAAKTLEYFSSNDVDIKIISGDSTSTVSSVAKKLGLEINGCVNLRDVKDDTDYKTLVEDNTIFGRVKPEQKKMIISALRQNGHVVAMTGDGVNDVLALKEADCGVAMNDGSDAARNVAELVLLDSNFDSMPKVVKEGRRTINNVERSATLFLSKTIYASLLAILFLFIKYTYPFIPIQMTLINSLTIGIPAFILALEPNHNRVKGKFLINVVSKALPSGITTVINILLLVFFAKVIGLSSTQTSTVAVIITAYTALLLIYRISKPLNILRKSLLIIITLVFIMANVVHAGRTLFSLEILTPNALLILLPLMYISTRIFAFASKQVNKLIIRKQNWFY